MVRIIVCGIAGCLMLGAAHSQRSQIPELTQEQADSRTVIGAMNEYLAAGAEAKLFRRVAVRSGFRYNTLGDEPGGHAPVYSLGASVATYRQLLVDAQVTLGSRAGDRGWGVAARLVY